MTAYVIFIKDGVKDPDEMAIYAEKAGAARGDHPLTPLVFYGDITTLEGPEAEGAVVLAFPDMAAARAWYDSPAYTEARAHRFKGADYRVLLVEGV
ncbi:DUF1330 domain-containing protein [Gallaecimonas pentaromativorans]|uniref:Uncharacterized protein (DUF1330 family) n=1 Tax=Gallaecimonas pentaromativorans TaxID=584787 RepID=A0A3N1P7U0_9GAMM|nr:DUF1330 domain-containing protein [Gallaecimonas pentaromativorans]ROQ24139.1 uncharacterized protein (DUF1330 family) [Gallaecimonas pentaromativorans]